MIFIEHSDDEPNVWTIDIHRHERGHISEYVDGPLTNGAIEVVPAEQLRGAVARAEAAEAHVEQLLAAENKAWREAETWKDRAVEADWLIASQRQEIRDMNARLGHNVGSQP